MVSRNRRQSIKPTTTAAMVCRNRRWHRKSECENTDKVAATSLKKMNSDLFHRNGDAPPHQSKTMTRNASVSPLLRLPPEIRLRIYKYVLGGQKLWIGYRPAEYIPALTDWNTQYYADRDIMHNGGGFIHTNNMARSGRGLDLRLLRVCRLVFMETALLPYALNEFRFETQGVRKGFEKRVRPGKKLAQKKAIGAYSILDLEGYQDELVRDMKRRNAKEAGAGK